MATSHAAAHGDHSHDPHATGGHATGGAGHATVRGYMTGFVLSIILTAIPFALVMSGAIPAASVVPIIIGLGLVQIVVHLVFFLHMNTSSTQLWNNAAFAFTVVILAILVVGSLWVMYHMNANMMPGMMPTD